MMDWENPAEDNFKASHLRNECVELRVRNEPWMTVMDVIISSMISFIKMDTLGYAIHGSVLVNCMRYE
jgi:hypothetical protein